MCVCACVCVLVYVCARVCVCVCALFGAKGPEKTSYPHASVHPKIAYRERERERERKREGEGGRDIYINIYICM